MSTQKDRLFERGSWLALGISIGLLGFWGYALVYSSGSPENCMRNFLYTSPSLGCSQYEESRERLAMLSSLFEEATAGYVQKGTAVRVSVWVRDLESKQWAASNEFESYMPASLMKVPVMIAYLRLSEVDPDILKKEIVYKLDAEDLNRREHFATSTALVQGTSYSIGKLLEHMTEESDNNAADLLLGQINTGLLSNTLVELGIQIPKGDEPIDFVTPKTYGNIFRILYNASNISRANSEKALQMLSTHKLDDFKGISYPLPSSVLVSDKYGESAQVGQSLVQLHDCGIVYKKPHPYTICIMTEGKKYDDLLRIIRELSAMAYERV